MVKEKDTPTYAVELTIKEVDLLATALNHALYDPGRYTPELKEEMRELYDKLLNIVTDRIETKGK